MTSPNTGRCRYHEDQPARWYCARCDLPLCGDCKPFAEQLPADPVCPLCRKPMDDTRLGTSLWRQPLPALAYATNYTAAATLALLTIMLALTPSGAAGLIAAGLAGLVLVRYAYVIIDRSSRGHVRPPRPGQLIAPEDLPRTGPMLVVTAAAALTVVLAAMTGSIVLTLAVSVVAAGLLPLMVMSVFVTPTVSAGFDYRRVQQVVQAARRPCIVLSTAFVLFGLAPWWLMRLASPVLPLWLETGLLGLVYGYLSMLAARMIGLVLYQYRRQFDYQPALARVRQHDRPAPGVYEPAQALADADILTAEQREDRARLTISAALVRHGDHPGLNQRFDRMLLQAGNRKEFRNHIERRLHRLVTSGQAEAAAGLWIEHRQALGNWLPRVAETRHYMALALEQRGYHHIAVKLLLRLPRTSPKYAQLPEACLEAARLLEHNLGDPEQAHTLRRWVEERFPRRVERWQQQRQSTEPLAGHTARSVTH
ncbi:MAG: hypothetical protein HND55_05660 [Pseudomonadota bacterium]|nr:MAG: hypothetical protein HND55_05660 [Pseudomonadota bacterium]